MLFYSLISQPSCLQSQIPEKIPFLRGSHMNAARLPFPDAAEPAPPADWQAAWIWSAEPTSGRHDYVYFRREFWLDAVPERVLVRLAAERDATLWLNGELIVHGPPISDPRWKRYETHNVTERLRTGANCIAVRVYHDTHCGAFTAHADARGLLCQVEADRAVLAATDESWRARVCDAYVKPGPRFGDSMWPEVFDANRDTPGWRLSGFDDGAWPPARRVIARAHSLWGAAQPQARFFPWVNLVPCETGPLDRIRHRPARVLTVGEVLQQREASAGDAAVRMSLEPIRPLEKAGVADADALVTGERPATIHNSSITESYETFDGLRNATIVLDFGRLMNARFGFRLSAPAGVVDIGYAYRLDDGRVVPYVSNRTPLADQYIARPGEQSWETADWRHFRYVQLTFRDLPGELVLDEVWADEIRNPFEARGQFTSSDSKLDRMFDLVRRTTELNAVDRTMDNPSRERRQYLGDCSGSVRSIMSCFGDTALVRRYFANADEGQHATGQYRYSYPGHDNDRTSLFDHALSLPLRLWEHYRLFGDAEMVGRMWPGVLRLLELARSCLDDRAMMTLPPYNVWFDWGHMDRRGRFLPLQAMTAEVMRRSAELARAAGESPEPWAEIADRMIGRIPRWFDDERGVFVDAIVDGARQEHVSEHANGLVAVWHLAPPAMIQSAFDRWAEDRSVFGQTSPAWVYLPGAFIEAGRPELAIQWLHDRLDQLERQGLDTWPETWCLFAERTIGTWRCRNSRAVAQGAGLGATTALLHGLCGIQPAQPGFAVVRITPQPGPLQHLAGVLPGPDGDYALELARRNGDWRLRLTIPTARSVVFDAAVAPDARSIDVNGTSVAAAETCTLPNGAAAARFRWDAEPVSVIVVRE
jgi:hypothetical protein